ncbi:MAG: hypothetical protein DHS20C16_22090 [Phycisphaerae bacterium]|nr:MAG: hypothetical protein DHS20C16_22090 [Phycisphaerae bacterium]
MTDGEEKIRQLVHEVHGKNISSEEISFQDNDATIVLNLNSPMERLQINLSNLARKHEEGVSLPVLKLSIDLGQ